jgi:excisionase family DNA binding protein
MEQTEAEATRPVQMLTVPQVAAILNVSQGKVWQLLARGKLDSVKIDASRRIREDVFAAYQAGLPTEHPAQPAAESVPA